METFWLMQIAGVGGWHVVGCEKKIILSHRSHGYMIRHTLYAGSIDREKHEHYAESRQEAVEATTS